MGKTATIPEILTLSVGYAVHDRDWNWTNIRSPFSRIYLVTKGTATVKTNNANIILTPGHLYMIPAFTTHQDICTGEFEHYYLHLFEDSAAIKSIMDEWDFPFEVEADELCHILFKQLCNINPTLSLPESNPKSYDSKPMLFEQLKRNRMRDMTVQMESRGIALQLLSRFFKHASRKPTSKDVRLIDSITYINKHLDEIIDIDTLARMSYISKDHYIRLFKKSFGNTPLQYINSLRIKRAEILLTTSSMTVKEIASTVGYYDHSYFIRIFRKKLGLTPLQYRQKSV